MIDTFFILPRNKAELVIREAMELASDTFVDELNAKISFHRRRSLKSANAVLHMGLGNVNTMFHFIIRNHDRPNDPITSDIGLSISKPNGITYFLFLNMPREVAYKLAVKHGLKQM